jgi:site-specific recombinase XerD
VSELVGLNVNDIDVDFLTVLGKGGKMRTTPIGAESYQVLNRYLKVKSCKSQVLNSIEIIHIHVTF